MRERTTDFGRALTSLRQSQGLTQADLAHLADVSAAYVSHLETGKRPPTSKAIRKLCGPLGTAPQDLLQAARILELPLNPPSASTSESLPSRPGLRRISIEGTESQVHLMELFWDFVRLYPSALELGRKT